jgi:L-galactono-1,4-lactone dehydrogenase
MLQLSLRKTLLRGCTSTFLVRNFSGTSKQSVFNITVKSARQEYQRDLSHKILYAFLGVALAEIYWRGSEGPSVCDLDVDCGVNFESGQAFTNWSSTHSCHPKRVYEPKSAQEVVRVLKLHHDRKTKLRPVGQALSPNGVGLSDPEARDKPSSDENMLSLAAIDYVEVDKEQQLVTVGAGATVSTVLKELRRHGLTLQNFSSIQEQQLGGWTQVAAHGTGCTLPTVDEMIVNMKVATPTEGIISLSETANPHYFRMAKVGLGSLGVVTELTLKCIPSMDLLEKTESSTRSLLNDEDHIERLKAFRHVRYMWIPYTPTVVTVVSNPVSTLTQADACSNCRSASSPSDVTVANATARICPQSLSAVCSWSYSRSWIRRRLRSSAFHS